MKKKLNIDSIKNELDGSVFFRPAEKPPEKSQELERIVVTDTPAPPPADTVIPRYRDTTNDTTTPQHRDTVIPATEEEMLEAVRKAVKQIGKEPATQRLTLEEKQALRAIEFTYAQQGIMTSGTEIIRIGMNFILKDYQKNGENSLLAKVLKRLNA